MSKQSIYAQFEAGFYVHNLDKLKEEFYKTEIGQRELVEPLRDEDGTPCEFNSGYAILELLSLGFSADDLEIEFADSVCSPDVMAEIK